MPATILAQCHAVLRVLGHLAADDLARLSECQDPANGSFAHQLAVSARARIDQRQNPGLGAIQVDAGASPDRVHR